MPTESDFDDISELVCNLSFWSRNILGHCGMKFTTVIQQIAIQ